MKKILLAGLIMFAVGLLVYGCGQQEQSATTTTSVSQPTVTETTTTSEDGTTTTVTTSTTTTTLGAGVSSLFNVSGAVAIASADNLSSSNVVNADGVVALSTTADDVLKLNASGELSSILTGESSFYTVRVIETGPDGSLYLGFSYPVWGYDETGQYSQLGAFFRIFTTGTAEVVDPDIYGIGTWYGSSDNGELPDKQVQFDSDGNIYYMGTDSQYNTILKMKSASDGSISQIGNSNMAVRDFLVCDNGFVLFHGSNASDWNVEWLRVIYNNSVNNVFYNSGSYGWLRSYYKDINNNVVLVGSSLVLLDEEDNERRYSGIIRVMLDETGAPTTTEALYDDNNMYSDSYNTIGEQLNYGYWDYDSNNWEKFFATDGYGSTSTPLTLETGVSKEVVDSYVRNKFYSISFDSLDSVSWEGMTTTESVTDMFNGVLDQNISGETWATWRDANGLNGVSFSNAKSLLFADSGELFAIMSLDSWGGSSVDGDKLFRIINDTGTASISAYPQDSSYKAMTRARLFENYCVYSSSKVGKYKLFRLDLDDPSSDPVNMIPDKNNVEIYSFNYNPVTGMLLFDVYDMSNNTSYLAQQEIDSTTTASETTAEGYTITDVVPFLVTAESTTATLPGTTTTLAGTTTTLSPTTTLEQTEASTTTTSTTATSTTSTSTSTTTTTSTLLSTSTTSTTTTT